MSKGNSMGKKLYKIFDVIKANPAWTHRRVFLAWFIYLVMAVFAAWAAATLCKSEKETTFALVVCCCLWMVLFTRGLMVAMTAVASVIFICTDGTLCIRLMRSKKNIRFDDMENVTVQRNDNTWLLDNGSEQVELPVSAFPQLDTELPKLMREAKNNPTIYREYPL